MMQKTVVLIKPDGLQRGLVGEIIHRFELKGLKLVGIKMLSVDDDFLEEWYFHLKDKDFFVDIKKYIKWTPIVAMAWEGLEAVSAVRKIVGITKSREAEAGSIRGDLGMSQQNNLMHASDSVESADRELKLVFEKSEIFDYKSLMDGLIYGDREVDK